METHLTPRPNPWFLAAALVMALTTLIHLFAGGADIYAPLRVAPLRPDLIAVLSVVWHMVTWVLGLMALALALAWRQGKGALSGMVALACLGFTVLFVAYGLGDLASLWRMPQWTIFALTLGLIALGHRRQA